MVDKEIIIDLKDEAGKMYLYTIILYLYLEKGKSVTEVADELKLPESEVVRILKDFKGDRYPEIKSFVWDKIYKENDWEYFFKIDPKKFWEMAQKNYANSLPLFQRFKYKFKKFLNKRNLNG